MSVMIKFIKELFEKNKKNMSRFIKTSMGIYLIIIALCIMFLIDFEFIVSISQKKNSNGTVFLRLFLYTIVTRTIIFLVNRYVFKYAKLMKCELKFLKYCLNAIIILALILAYGICILQGPINIKNVLSFTILLYGFFVVGINKFKDFWQERKLERKIY